MYLFIFVVLNILSYVLGQTPLPLGSPPASIMLDATNNIQLFTITNACMGPNLYTVTAQSFGVACFKVTLLDQNNVPVPINPPNPNILDVQMNAAGNTVVLIRRPNGGITTPPCTQETVQIALQTGFTGSCQGQVTVEASNIATSDINTLNQTMLPLVTTQYSFFQFNNLVIGNSYVLLVEMTPDNVNPFIDTTTLYPTQYNCKDFIGLPGSNNRFRVFQATTLTTLNIGLNAMNPIKFSIQTYQANTVPLQLGNGPFQTTLDSSKFNFYNLPPGMGNMASLSITNVNHPLVLFLSNTQDPNQFTGGTPIPIAANVAQPQTIALNGMTFATIYNPVGNVATATYAVQVSNTPGMPIPQMPTNAPTLVQNTMVLALPLYAIIVICVGIVLLIAALIASLYIYNKWKSKKKQEYKPVAAAAPKKESTSTSSSQDDTESDYTDDSYEEPRQYSRRQQRNRSYDDDEDDYDSSDYS